jgi:hypothetical protein
MDQCSRHDTPSAIAVHLTNLPGHDLAIELDAREPSVLTGKWLGESLSSRSRTFQSH